MTYEEMKSSAPIIVARLSGKFGGGRIALLCKADKPYDYYAEDGEEIPLDAIESWQEVDLPKAESEDEKIRKHIIKILDGLAPCHWDGNEKGECLAWLKKQKENPQSVDSIQADCVSSAKCEDRWRKVGDSFPDNGREVLAKDKFGNILLARYDGEGWDVSVYDDEDYRCHNGISKWCEIPSEKQKEQKPIFKKGDKVIWDDEEFNILDVNVDSYNVGGYILPFYRQNELSLVEQKPASGNSEKPNNHAEWSEEDEERIRSILFSIGYCEDEYPNKKDYSKDIAWLKSLRPQPHTVSIEKANKVAELEYERGVKDGLNHHWKPTEEQVEAVSRYINGEFMRAEDCMNMKSLYNDLKKLM